jgi:hypothetical protein
MTARSQCLHRRRRSRRHQRERRSQEPSTRWKMRQWRAKKIGKSSLLSSLRMRMLGTIVMLRINLSTCSWSLSRLQASKTLILIRC